MEIKNKSKNNSNRKNSHAKEEFVEKSELTHVKSNSTNSTKNCFMKIVNDQNSLRSTGSSDSSKNMKDSLLLKEENGLSPEDTLLKDENERFSLRKRRKINYNFKTKMFEYDGEDSDYEEKPKKKNKKNKPDKKNSGNKNLEKRLKENPNPKECRSYQLDSLLGWKKYDVKQDLKKGESDYIELDDIVSSDLNSYAKDLQAILINPPWSNKAPKFEFNKFSKMKLPLNKMKEGLIFIWTEKEYIHDVVYYFENMDIKYVENMVWITLNSNKINQNSTSQSSDPFNINDIFKNESYEGFSKSHLTLLIFRKFLPNNKRTLELRHQRTGDAVFDHYNNENKRPFYYVYRLIEILLPRANYTHGEPLRMMEIFGRKDFRRKGWIHIVQK